MVDEEGRTLQRGTFRFRAGANPFILQAFINSFEPEGVCVAMAGVWTEEERRGLAEAVGLDIIVVSDAEAALFGAFEGEPGVVVVAGTGSIALAWNGRELLRAGGFGPLVGDPGSGHWLGAKGYAAGRAAAEGWGEDTELRSLTLPRGYDVHQVAALSKRVLEHAEAGDGVALRIAREGAQLLAKMGAALAERAGLRRVSWQGGLFKNEFYLKLFKENLVKLGLSPTPPARSPEEGAALIALRGGF